MITTCLPRFPDCNVRLQAKVDSECEPESDFASWWIECLDNVTNKIRLYGQLAAVLEYEQALYASGLSKQQ